jgi:hypothetical protein
VCFSREKCQKNLCLPDALEKLEDFEAQKRAQECVVAGFGYTKNYTNSNPPILQETVVKFYNYEKCAKWNENWNLFFGEHLCYGMKVSLTKMSFRAKIKARSEVSCQNIHKFFFLTAQALFETG